MVVWGGAMVCRTKLIPKANRTNLLLLIPGDVVSAYEGMARGGGGGGTGGRVGRAALPDLAAQHALLPLHYASTHGLAAGNAPAMARDQGELGSGVI